MTMRTLALAVIILFLFDPGYSQQLRRVDSVKVVDARSRTVGKGTSPRFIGSGALAPTGGVVAVTVILEVDGHLISALAFRNFLSANNFSLQGPYFTSTDCSGTPYLIGVPAPEQGLLPDVAINIPGDTVYIRDSDAEPQTVTIHSTLLATPDDHGVCAFNPPGFSARMFPARPLIDLDTQFTPPFRVIATSEHDHDDEDDTR